MGSIHVTSLLSPEVLNNICLSILRPHRGEGLETLASLARTSRLFHEPAVNAIWGSIPDILALIHTLPEDLWLETRVKFTPNDRLSRYFGTQLTFKRPPIQSDFARLKHYAHRIKHVLYANTCLIPPGVFNALTIHFPAGTLLPNTRSIIYQYLMPPPSEPNHCLDVLFGPKLDKIHVICMGSSQGGAQLRTGAENFRCIRALPHMCPRLSTLSIRIDPGPKVPVITVVPEMILAFQDLTRLIVHRILLDLPAVLHLVRLQNLEVLDALLSDEVRHADVQSLASMSTGGQPYFPSLKKLSLNHRSLSLLALLLKLVSSSNLDEVIFCTSSDLGPNCTSEDVCELLVELSRHLTLTCIIISVDSLVTGPGFNNTTLEPLLSLPHLRVLNIDIAHPLNIDDAMMVAMAITWRSLTRLSLCVARPPPGPLSRLDTSIFCPTATLYSLDSFIPWCPDLEWLGLPLNTDLWRVRHGPGRLEIRPGCGEGLTEMTFLDVGLSVVHYPESVAAFLSDLFPGLEGIRTAWRSVREEDMDADMVRAFGSPGDIVGRWEQVADLVDAFTTVRKQERTWRAAHGKGPEPVEDTS